MATAISELLETRQQLNECRDIIVLGIGLATLQTQVQLFNLGQI